MIFQHKYTWADKMKISSFFYYSVCNSYTFRTARLSGEIAFMPSGLFIYKLILPGGLNGRLCLLVTLVEKKNHKNLVSEIYQHISNPYLILVLPHIIIC